MFERIQKIIAELVDMDPEEITENTLIPEGNEPSGCVSIHLANAARVIYSAACSATSLMPRCLQRGC